jgi:hypothetical protein
MASAVAATNDTGCSSDRLAERVKGDNGSDPIGYQAILFKWFRTIGLCGDLIV